MRHNTRWLTMFLTAGLLAASTAVAQNQIRIGDGPPMDPVPGGVPGMGGVGQAAGNQVYTGSTMPVGSQTSIVLRAISNLNIEPDFTLTIAQKVRIQAATDQLDKTVADWRAAHKVELEKGEKEYNDAMQGGDADRFAAAQKVMDALYKTIPQAGDLDKRLIAVLTEAQKKAVAKEVDNLTSNPAMGGGVGDGQRGMLIGPVGGKN